MRTTSLYSVQNNLFIFTKRRKTPLISSIEVVEKSWVLSYCWSSSSRRCWWWPNWPPSTKPPAWIISRGRCWMKTQWSLGVAVDNSEEGRRIWVTQPYQPTVLLVELVVNLTSIVEMGLGLNVAKIGSNNKWLNVQDELWM